MTARKPGHLTFTSWIEHQIAQARDRGELDGLPGKGKPLPDVEGPYDPDWWLKQWMRREKLAPLPPALELRRDFDHTLERLRAEQREAVVREELERLNARIRKVNATTVTGPPSMLAPLDVERAVRRWRAGKL